MNLEMDFIKKEIQSLKDTIQALREEIENEKKYSGFQLTYSFVQENNTTPIVDLIKDVYTPIENTKTYYSHTSWKDPRYMSPLLSNIQATEYKIQLFIEYSKPILLDTFTSKLKTQPINIKPYKHIETMRNEMKFEHYTREL